MKSTKQFNNISNELKAKIPRLKPGEVVTFQMLNGIANPDPDEKEKAKEPVLYGKKQIRTNFRIYDEGLRDDASKEVVGGYVDVGCVDIWNGDKPDRFRMFVPGMGQHSRFPGKFSLIGGRQQDEELFEILWLSPEREGSLFKDASIAPLYRILDLKADSKAAVTKFDILKKALDFASKLDEHKARAIMAALNQPTYQDKEVLMAKVGDLARTKPEIFIQTYESPDTETKLILREALDKGVIDHDLSTDNVNMGGVVLSKMKVESSESFLHEFTRWLSSAENGKDVLNNIKKQLDKGKEVAK